MTDDRKRKTGGEVELLPLPPRLAEYGETSRSLWQDYARANVDRALAESRAEVEEVQAMLFAELSRNERLEARAERLTEAVERAMTEAAP